LLLAGAAVAGWYVYQRVNDELTAREPVAVPNVVGLKRNRAVAIIERNDLEAKISESFSERPPGEVLDQDPNAGTRIQKGQSVTITVSAGVEQVSVPRVVGKDVAEAISILNNDGFDVVTRKVFSDQPENTVTKQNPKAGATVDRGSRVTLNVSQGVQTVTVPDVLSQGQDDATGEIQQAGLEVNVVQAESDTEAGVVIDQDPDAGVEAEIGSTVTITVSTGPSTVSVDSVIGLDENSAIAQLEGAGFQVDVQEQTVFNPDNDGVVIDQSPAPGEEVDPGSTVTILVGRFILGSDETDSGAADTTTIG
jgi:serine/threonine-protein kinase